MITATDTAKLSIPAAIFGLVWALVQAWLTSDNPTPSPEPQPVPVVVPAFPPGEPSVVDDVTGRTIDAPETIEVAKTPGSRTVYFPDSSPRQVVVGGAPVPPAPPAPPRPEPKPGPQPTPQPEPSPVVDPAFADVARIVKAGDPAKVLEVHAAFLAFADVCDQHPPTTTGALRSALADYEQLAFAGTPLAGAFPGFSSAANAGLLKLLGDEDRPLKAGEAASAIRKLAEACK